MDLSRPILSPGYSCLGQHVWDTVDLAIGLFYPRVISCLGHRPVATGGGEGGGGGLGQIWAPLGCAFPFAVTIGIEVYPPPPPLEFCQIQWTPPPLLTIPGYGAARTTCFQEIGLQWTYSIPGPLAASDNMPEIQWTYSIPGPLAASDNMPEIHVDLFYPRAVSRLGQHAWDTVDLFYPRAVSRLGQHAWDTVDLFYPRAVSRLGQHAWDTVDLFYPRAVSRLGQHAWDTRGPILSPGR